MPRVSYDWQAEYIDAVSEREREDTQEEEWARYEQIISEQIDWEMYWDSDLNEPENDECSYEHYCVWPEPHHDDCTCPDCDPWMYEFDQQHYCPGLCSEHCPDIIDAWLRGDWDGPIELDPWRGYNYSDEYWSEWQEWYGARRSVASRPTWLARLCDVCLALFTCGADAVPCEGKIAA